MKARTWWDLAPAERYEMVVRRYLFGRKAV